MPEYDTDDERPPRRAIYEREMERVVPAQFDVEQYDIQRHPQIKVYIEPDSPVAHIRIYDMRIRVEGDEKVCCRVRYPEIQHIDHGDEDFDTLDEAETWLMEATKQMFEWQQNASTITESLNTQVTLH